MQNIRDNDNTMEGGKRRFEAEECGHGMRAVLIFMKWSEAAQTNESEPGGAAANGRAARHVIAALRR